MIRKAIIFSLVATHASCASSGTGSPTTRPERVNRVTVQGAGRMQLFNDPGVGSRTVPFSRAAVWQSLPVVYGQLEIPDAGADEQNGMFGNPNFNARRIEGKRLSTYIDCGMGATAVPNADSYNVMVGVLTELQAAGDTATIVTTTLDATGRPRSVSGNPVHCQSKGILEMRVAQLVMFELLQSQ